MKKIVIISIVIIIIAIIIVSLSIEKPITNSTFQPPSITPNNEVSPNIVQNNMTLSTTPKHLDLSLDESMRFRAG